MARRLVVISLCVTIGVLGLQVAAAGPPSGALDQFKAGGLSLDFAANVSVIDPNAGFWDWVRVVAGAVTVFITVWCMESRWGCD